MQKISIPSVFLGPKWVLKIWSSKIFKKGSKLAILHRPGVAKKSQNQAENLE